MKPLIILSAAALLALGQAAAAQDTNNDTGDQKKPVENCQVQPGQEQSGDGSQGQSSTGQNDSLTDTLSPCNGVLKPPPTGDTDLTEPAPPEGNTPIIRPGDVPPQPVPK